MMDVYWLEQSEAAVPTADDWLSSNEVVRLRAHERFRTLEANGATRARELAVAMNRIRTEWQNVWIGAVEDGPENNVPVASTIRVQAQVHLGRLTPQEVAVDLYLGRVAPEGELMEGRAVPL